MIPLLLKAYQLKAYFDFKQNIKQECYQLDHFYKKEENYSLIFAMLYKQ